MISKEQEKYFQEQFIEISYLQHQWAGILVKNKDKSSLYLELKKAKRWKRINQIRDEIDFQLNKIWEDWHIARGYQAPWSVSLGDKIKYMSSKKRKRS